MTNIEAYERYAGLRYAIESLASYLLIEVEDTIRKLGVGYSRENPVGIVKKYYKSHSIDSIDNGSGKDGLIEIVNIYINAVKTKSDININVSEYVDKWLNEETYFDTDYAEKALADKDSQGNYVDV